MNKSNFFIIEYFLIGVIGLLLFVLAMAHGAGRVTNDAIKNGVAEYYIDKNNNKAFRWKTNTVITTNGPVSQR